MVEPGKESASAPKRLGLFAVIAGACVLTSRGATSNSNPVDSAVDAGGSAPRDGAPAPDARAGVVQRDVTNLTSN